MSVKRTGIVVVILIVVGAGGYFGYRFVSKLMTWRHLDQAYQEQFKPPAEIAPELNGKTIVFHMKTGLDQDDSQICVGFNVIFASLEAGAEVTVVFDAGADEQKPGQAIEMVACRQQNADEPSAYERVLGDAMKGDATLFARQDYAEEAWRIVDPVLKAGLPVHQYARKTWGPKKAGKTVVPPGGWHDPVVSRKSGEEIPS